MKKLTALLLALIMTLALAACGGDSSQKDNAPPAEPDTKTDAPAEPEKKDEEPAAPAEPAGPEPVTLRIG